MAGWNCADNETQVWDGKIAITGEPRDDKDLTTKGHLDSNAWLQSVDQTGLTGDKTGSFDITTTGVGTFGESSGIEFDDASAILGFSTNTNLMTFTPTDVSIDSDLIFTDSGSGLPFGEVWVMGNSTADTVATATNTQMTRFANEGESNLTTPSATTDDITILKAGMYLVTISVAFKGDASVEWDFTLYKNNGATSFDNVHCDRKLGAGGDVGSASMSGICDFAVNDTIELWMKHEAGVNKDITIEDCTLSIVQIGGT